MSDKIDIREDAMRNGAGAPSRRGKIQRPEGGPSPAQSTHYRHLAHVSSFRDNPIVFITVCTKQRRKLLACSQSHQILREIWERSAARDGWWVGHYILMPDHVHFFARPEIDSRPLAAWVQMWKSVSSRIIAASLGVRPSVWQPEYFDRYLRSSDSYSEKWDYVALNAVRANLVSRASDRPYQGTISDLMF